MNISSHEEYGLRCLLRLAKSERERPVSASRIAEHEGISVEYVSKFMHLFRKAELVESVRGMQGGFRLAREASEISLHEVVKALSPQRATAKEFCQQFAGQNEHCANISDCSLRPLWSTITSVFERVIAQLRLSDFMASESQVQARVNEVFRQNLNLSSSARSPELSQGESYEAII